MPSQNIELEIVEMNVVSDEALESVVGGDNCFGPSPINTNGWTC